MGILIFLIALTALSFAVLVLCYLAEASSPIPRAENLQVPAFIFLLALVGSVAWWLK